MTEPKVDKGRTANGVDQDIGSLQVFMRHVHHVEGMNGDAQPTEEGDELIMWPRLFDVGSRMWVKGREHVANCKLHLLQEG